jgi:hypothetical protein
VAADKIFDNPIIDYLKKHVRNHEGLPYWSLATGVQGVMMQMGWDPPEHKEEVPAKCPKSYNPYTYCPLAFRHEDEMILDYIHQLVVDIKRINGIGMSLSGEDAQMVDRYACQITAYMNGRIHELLNFKKKEE